MEAKAQRAVTRFHCLQDACPDTCCAGLTIPVEPATVTRLEQEFAASPEGVELRGGLEPTPEGTVLAKRSGGACRYLEGGLCALQRRFGEQVLPGACSTFPRVPQRVSGALEVTGSLACPELARLALLADDGLEWEAFEPERLPRPAPTDDVPGDEPLRAAMLNLLDNGELPLASRVVTLAHLAHEVRAAPEAAPPRLMRNQLVSMHRNFSGLQLPVEQALTILSGALSEVAHAKRTLPSSAAFVGLCDDLAARVAGHAPESGDGGEPPSLSRPFRLEWERATMDVRTRLGVLLGRRARHQLLRHPPHPEQALLEVGRLVLKLAMIRFVLAFGGGLSAATPELADALFVEAVQKLAKHFDGSGEVAALEQALFAQNPEQGFFAVLLFAKLLAD